MTPEEKQLLLKDLCARLPYDIKCQVAYDEENADLCIEIYFDDMIVSICPKTEEIGLYEASEYFYPDEIKPYLRPMSSMTEEENEEFIKLQNKIIYNPAGLVTDDVNEYKNFIYQHHLDDGRFIEKGLAIEAPEGMYLI